MLIRPCRSIASDRKEEYKVFRECFFAQCALSCLREFLGVDGLQFYFIVDCVSTPEFTPPEDFSKWAYIDEDDNDEIVIRMFNNEKDLELIQQFYYKISEFIGDYENGIGYISILTVFDRIAEVFQKDYIKFYMEEYSKEEK